MVKPSGLERMTRWKEPTARLQLDSITWWCNTGWAGTCSDGIIIKDIFTHRVRWKINTNQYWDGIFSYNTTWLKLDSSRLTSCPSLVDRFPYVVKWLFTSVCIISLILGCLSGSPNPCWVTAILPWESRSPRALLSRIAGPTPSSNSASAGAGGEPGSRKGRGRRRGREGRTWFGERLPGPSGCFILGAGFWKQGGRACGEDWNGGPSSQKTETEAARVPGPPFCPVPSWSLGKLAKGSSACNPWRPAARSHNQDAEDVARAGQQRRGSPGISAPRKTRKEKLHFPEATATWPSFLRPPSSEHYACAPQVSAMLGQFESERGCSAGPWRRREMRATWGGGGAATGSGCFVASPIQWQPKAFSGELWTCALFSYFFGPSSVSSARTAGVFSRGVPFLDSLRGGEG